MDDPSNSSMIQVYEERAKNHLHQYLHLLKKKPRKSSSGDTILIGSRKLKNKTAIKEKNRQIPKKAAINFIENLMNSFHSFKDYCSDHMNSNECTVLNDDNAILINALKNYGDQDFM